MAYKEMKLNKGEAKGLFDSWNDGFDGKPTAKKKTTTKKAAPAKKTSSKKK
ncbi:MAG: hypothetical protein PHS82_02950 [Lachnospiraceae bacterium]|nr:hypothetical protein [Lachnospiraceae bacterium]